MATQTRVWDGTPNHPTDFVDFSACKCVDTCTCPRKVELSMRTADGRVVRAALTPDEAEELSRRLSLAAECARS